MQTLSSFISRPHCWDLRTLRIWTHAASPQLNQPMFGKVISLNLDIWMACLNLFESVWIIFISFSKTTLHTWQISPKAKSSLLARDIGQGLHFIQVSSGLLRSPQVSWTWIIWTWSTELEFVTEFFHLFILFLSVSLNEICQVSSGDLNFQTHGAQWAW